MAVAILCFDIGGTSIKHGLYSQEGQLIASYPSVPTNADQQAIIQTIRELIWAVKENSDIEGIAISSAGVIDSDRGSVIYSGYTIPNYTGTAFKDVLESEFGIPCEVENDVNAACLAELWQGAGQGYRSIVCLTIGTGVGGAVMIDGQLVKGVGLTAGEVGYMLVGDHYFQDVASTTFLVNRANQLSEQLVNDGREVFEWAKKADGGCVQAIAELVDHLASGLVNIIYLLNPEIIILGGGIMSQKTYLNDKLVERVSEKLISPLFDKSIITFAENQNNAGMLGALYHFNQRHSR